MKQYGRSIASGGIALGLICALTLENRTVLAQVQQFDRFADWCENREKLTKEARHTVEVLLRNAQTEDCQIAEEQLSNLRVLYLWSNKIADVSALSSLDNLTGLFLNENPIVDRTCPVEPQSICRF